MLKKSKLKKVLIISISQLLEIVKVHIFTVDFFKVLIICIPHLLKILKVHILQWIL